MKHTLGIINLNEQDELLADITYHRPLAAVPFGGRYRLIDFILSNMVNSGIRNVGILVCNNYRSLIDHLRSGKEWDLARKRDGLFILPPDQSPHALGGYRGDIDQIYQHIDYIKRCAEKYVLMAGSRMVCNIDFQDVFRFHREKQADVTVIYKEEADEGQAYHHATLLEVDPTGRVTDVAAAPRAADRRLVSLKMFYMDKELLINLIERAVSRGEHDFSKDCLIKNLDKLTVCGYSFPGYAARIHSTGSYFQHNMALLNPSVRQELFSGAGPVYTKVKDEPPAKYLAGAQVHNSLIANGCFIEGTVENSILFRGVRVRSGAYIANSIIMQNSDIGPHTDIQYSICDKEVQIRWSTRLRGERNYPLVIKKGTVV